MDTNNRLDNSLRYAKQRFLQYRRLKGSVYVVCCEGFVKIGFATSVSARLSNLQIGCPFELKLMKVFKSDDIVEMERKLHRELVPYWHRGEWFKLPDWLMERLLRAETVDSFILNV